MDPFETTLRQIRTRLALRQWLLFTLQGLAYAAWAACGWVLLTRLFPMLGDAAPVCLALLALGLIIAAGMALHRRPGLVDAALAADRKLGLKERFTSSLEMGTVEGLSEREQGMVDALHVDARHHLKQIDPGHQFSILPGGGSRWAAFPLVLLGLGYVLLPQWDLLGHDERIAEARELEDALEVRVDELKSAVKTIKKEKPEEADLLAEVEADVAKLAEEMRAQTINEKQAMARVSKLTDKLREHREQLAQENPNPKLAGDVNKLGMGQQLAKALQEGKMGEAGKKAKELQEKLKKGELDLKEMKALSKDLSSISKMMSGSQSQLSQALAKALAAAQAASESGDKQAAQEALELAALALEDMESILDQLQKMDVAMASLSEWQQGALGPSEYCRICGSKLSQCKAGGGQCNSTGGHKHNGVCGSCSGSGQGKGGQGLGMGGPGRGRGNQVGELPDLLVGFQPTMLNGPMTKGKMLAEIMEKTAPEEGQEASIDYIQGAFVEVQQAAEQALTQQETPAASKELVREYFKSLEPEDQ